MSSSADSASTTIRADGDGTPTAGATLRTRHLLLMIVAAAAPLGVAIGNLPIGIVLGNGIGLPAAFLAAAIIIACLATGFIRLARQVRAEGGFADLVRAGLGEGAGLGVAYVTGIAYWTGSLALAASTGYFGNLIAHSHGIDIPWWVYSFVAYGIILTLGRRAADLSARLLLALMVAEVAVVVALDLAIIVNHGASAFPVDVFALSHALSGNLGPAVLIGFTSFIGVESAVLYTRETRDPGRSVPRATYGAVVAIGALYVLTAWLIIGSLGTSTAVAKAGELQGDLVFTVAGNELGSTFTIVVQIFFVTSLMACFIALHNASSRYTHTLADRGALPRTLATLHPTFRSPARASTALAGIGLLLFIAFAATGADPYIGLATSLTGLFTLGIVAAQALVAISVVVYFIRNGARFAWSTVTAPLLGGVGALLACAAIVANYSVLVGSNSLGARLVPLILLVALVAGFAVHAVRHRAPARRGQAPQEVVEAA
ncbi:APC family permease [Williamsia sterculiae]|uniref:Amino acid/polyamine/organocation transporter, APC superfamily n=1 Tax=Williamsia sterculiae TaxID=1344003 RepID=A0A1N7GVX1_9NOCA|nr:APC family permease [Williamsia sterculiae]SIS16735.1 amino acid/polyamine/organocation transporter, APC superfamily [Williamsia sterculiae]